MKRIVLTHGLFSLVDDDIYEMVGCLRWRARQYKHLFYAEKDIRLSNGRFITLRLHHVVMGQPIKGREIDHISGDGLDNRRCNLRIVTRRENASNQNWHRNAQTSSRYVGVYWDKSREKWKAQITVGNKNIALGRFISEAEAHEARKRYEERLNEI